MTPKKLSVIVSVDRLKAFLDNICLRKDAVCIDMKSELKPVICDLPQSSILGPLIFNVSLNNISNMNSTVKFIIYVDDTSTFFTGNDLEILVRECDDTMSELQKWSEYKWMHVNEKKTQAAVFRPENN